MLKRTIAVTCVLATACFVILWMRSLRYNDRLCYVSPTTDWIEIKSDSGDLTFGYLWIEQGGFAAKRLTWDSHEFSTDLPVHFHFPSVQLSQSTIGNKASTVFTRDIKMPYWLLTVIFCIVGVNLSIKRPFRFSLRTLAIAATAIVLTLGMGVAASRLTLG